MRIVTKAQMEQLMLEHPDGGIVFADYHPDVIDDIHYDNSSDEYGDGYLPIRYCPMCGRKLKEESDNARKA